MGILHTLRNRRDGVIAPSVTDDAAFEERETKESQDFTESDSDTLSLEARNEKEVQLHPNQVTQNADVGVQKAEAAALVWGKKAVWLTYGW